jgi:uncharacterized protein with HEPN domain
MPERDAQFWTEILEAIEDIKSFTMNISFQDFIDDKKTRLAVVRCLEIIGEASRNISTEAKQEHKEIDWKGMIGMRDKLIHHYFGVSYEIVWDTMKKDLPKLEEQIRKILEKDPNRTDDE